MRAAGGTTSSIRLAQAARLISRVDNAAARHLFLLLPACDTSSFPAVSVRDLHSGSSCHASEISALLQSQGFSLVM